MTCLLAIINFCFNLNSRFTTDLHKLIFAMLKVSAEERPSVEEVLSMVKDME